LYAVRLNRSFGLVVTWVVAVMTWQIVRTRLALRKQAWLRSGQNRLAEQLIGDVRADQLGTSVLQFLAGYLDAQVGVFYVAEGDRLRRVAGFALDTRANPQSEFRIGESLVGQAAVEKRPLLLREIPQDYLKVTSGLGGRTPTNLIVAPVAADHRVNGVIELGFLHPVHGSDLELLQLLGDSIGVALRSANDRTQLEHLLQQTQQQAEELQTQQEELRVSNEELEEQGKALGESHARLELQQAELEQTNVQLEEYTQLLERQKADLSATQTVLMEKGEELERASRYKSEFLANMSHELRTPLNSALILAKLLADNKDGNLTADQVKFARSIYSAGNDLLDLINDILDLSKIESGRLDVRPEPVPLDRVLDGIVRTFRPMADQKHLAFSATMDEGAPATIETDARRLEQILKNLLSNALKFTDRGEVRLRVAADAGWVRFIVRDTGIGIPAAQHDAVFEAFQQADGTTNRRYGGTGLGLSISRDLAQLLGGEIQLESAPGQGSTFTLTLPVQYVPAAAPVGIAEVAAAVTASAGVPDIPATPRVDMPPVPRRAPAREAPAVEDDRDRIGEGSRVLLVVEDDPAFARILYDLAHDLGFLCLLAPTADSGIALAQEFRPTAIVLDMNLPDHSGLTVLDRLKRNPATRHIPVQVASVEDYARTALEMGAAGYMLKPVKREELIEALSKLESKYTQGIRSVLVVEDDPRQRESIRQLLGEEHVRVVPVDTAAAALEQLRTTTYDCMVLDITLPDASGFELLQRMAEDSQYSFPPVIVYTGRSLSEEQERQLRRYSSSIIIKGARSPERLLDEVTLFLHQIEASLPPDRQRMLAEARRRDAIFENRTVLIVEDDVRNIFALSSVLEPRGAAVRIARNGREAIEVLASGAPIDLVLMDIMMPEMDGYEAMREIRRRAGLQKLPIIALTARAMQDDHDRCLAAGANDYIAKPIDIEQLLSLMRVWMPR
jgi:signal transduction histidine kinase/CheY-like chemotaxis protein